MNALKCLYALTSHNNIEVLKIAERTRLILPDSTIEEWDKDLSKKLTSKKFPTPTDSSYLILEMVKRGESRGYLLLAIPVKIDIPNDESGFFLHPNPIKPIQINPEYLLGEHNEGKPELILASSSNALENVAAYYQLGTLKSWLKEAKELFYHTCEVSSLQELTKSISGQLGNNDLTAQFSISSVLDSEGSLTHISNLYRGLLADRAENWQHTPLKKLLATLEGTSCSQTVSTQFLETQTGWYSGHIDSSPIMGHMDTKTGEGDPKKARELFPLDNTQRHAAIMARHLGACEAQHSELGHILAVSGPPGSGKTSMLKAVIAQESVLAALEGRPCPIIVAAGATNQSVKNVVSAFPDVLHDDDDNFILYQRWLPKINNYGSFLASNDALKKFTEEEKAKTPVIESFGKERPFVFGWTSVCEELNQLKSLPEHETYYLAKLQRHCQKLGYPYIDDIEQAKHYLHKYLTEKSTEMLAVAKHCVAQIRAGHFEPKALFPISETYYSLPYFVTVREEFSAWLQMDRTSRGYLDIVARLNRERIRDEAIPEVEYGEKLHGVTVDIYIEHLLDTSYRPLLFHIAARYWEAEYLLSLRKSVLFAQTEDNIIEGLRRICMVTPVIISTLHMLPKLLQVKSYTPGAIQRSFVYGGIDLLITDESGQADIRLGLPSMSLCRKLISVGDISQLEPVIDNKKDISAYDDYSAWLKEGYSAKQITRLIELGFTPTSGSLLHLVMHASTYSYQGAGFMLRGHYRCFQKIIDYCNQMVYDNKLFYLPSNDKEIDREDLPAMAYVETPGSSETGKGKKSKVNYQEANLIAEMVVLRYRSWQERLKKGDALPALASMLAIVTPFNKQPEVIRAALYKTNEAHGYVIPECEIKDTTIDTIHKLQGAEKDIVIFSGVQTHSDSAKLFFEKQPFLLNVAVSRAKKSFIAVICPKLYQLNQGSFDLRASKGLGNSVQFLGRYLNQHGKRLFPKHLFIVEAKGKVTVLSRMLGQEYVVYPTNGAVTKSGLQEDNVDTARRQLLPDYGLNNNGIQALDAILTEGPKVKSILLATDNDNVGETIAWHLFQHTKKIAPELTRKMIRVPLNAITQEHVNVAKDNPRDFDLNMVSAEISRDIIDKWVAQRMYAVIQQYAPLKNKKAIGMGRVKAAVIDLLNKQKMEAERVRSTSINVTLSVNGRKIQGRLSNMSPNDVIKFKNQLKDKNITSMVSDPERYSFNKFESKFNSYSPPNRSTAGLLRYAYLNYKFPPSLTMALLQRLYIGDNV
ncbi:AAA domain-containing protein [Vibrio cholerae]|uniref:AAA domain-containing protein n=1 Tax=Vibrio cholerae TaxID=666 RepID=UPI0030800C16